MHNDNTLYSISLQKKIRFVKGTKRILEKKFVFFFIGTLSRKFDVHSYIYTGDRDSYQLVNDRVNVCYTRKGVSDLLELSADNFKDEIGLEPLQIIEEKALMGLPFFNAPWLPYRFQCGIPYHIFQWSEVYVQ